jgi:hypothetical protein
VRRAAKIEKESKRTFEEEGERERERESKKLFSSWAPAFDSEIHPTNKDSERVRGEMLWERKGATA